MALPLLAIPLIKYTIASAAISYGVYLSRRYNDRKRIKKFKEKLWYPSHTPTRVYSSRVEIVEDIPLCKRVN
jgi:hypothetical protein